MKLNLAKDDMVFVGRIVERAAPILKVNPLDLMMDLAVTHLNGCALRLADLADADDFNLIHDVGGIRQNLDRRTGRLTRCFLPRFAA